jgi:hypothetical protein
MCRIMSASSASTLSVADSGGASFLARAVCVGGGRRGGVQGKGWGGVGWGARGGGAGKQGGGREFRGGGLGGGKGIGTCDQG